MPRARIHKSEKARRQANRDKSKRYYVKNSEKIKSEKKARRDQVLTASATDRSIQAKKREENITGPVHRSMESIRDIRIEYNMLTNYHPMAFFEGVFQQLQPYYVGNVTREENSSNTPLHSYQCAFNRLSHKISTVSGRILNENGAGPAFDEAQRAQMVVRSCLDVCSELEVGLLLDVEGRDVLKRHRLGTLRYQDKSLEKWFNM
ncbi:hypothetical protein V5O48_013076 [Marasmius crinis-equi]|uniref:BZIP domain-containing protein n=1 Tax=Marasmius crinis-equi TaxID=585013 RepID=A0ABR3F119_9AGAR